MDDEIPEREDVQLGGVNGILHLAFRRHVDEVTRISGQDGGHCWIYVPGHAQVSNLGSEVLSEQNVGSSEVSVDEGRGQRVKVAKALRYIIEDVDSSGKVCLGILLDKVSQIRMKPLHYQTDVVLVTAVMNSLKADHVGIIQALQNATFVAKFSHNEVSLLSGGMRVVVVGLEQDIVELFCNTLFPVHCDFEDYSIGPRTHFVFLQAQSLYLDHQSIQIHFRQFSHLSQKNLDGYKEGVNKPSHMRSYRQSPGNWKLTPHSAC